MSTHCLAQINIAHGRAPIDDPVMHGFASRLQEINEVAERSPGFLWRLTSEDGRSSGYVQAFDDPCMIVNVSTWESLDALRAYVYRSEHSQLVRARAKWFRPMSGPTVALWWVESHAVVTVEDGLEHLATLARLGPTVAAFTFKQHFRCPEPCASSNRPTE